MANVGAGLSLPSSEVKGPAQPSRRKVQRLPEYDYTSAGAYFVTICVKGRQPILGMMVDNDVRLSRGGELVTEVWRNLAQHYGSVEMDEFIVMPNHIHGILWIREQTPIATVGAGLRPAQPRREGLRPSPTKNKNHALPEIIRAFKSFSAREVNKQTPGREKFAWQRGFYEHIIRNDDDLYQVRSYIRNNPLKWGADEYYAAGGEG